MCITHTPHGPAVGWPTPLCYAFYLGARINCTSHYAYAPLARTKAQINYALHFSATVYRTSGNAIKWLESRQIDGATRCRSWVASLWSPRKHIFAFITWQKFLQPQKWGKKGNPTSFLASWHIIEAHRRLVYNAVISMAILWLRVLQNFMDSACFWWRFHLQNFCTISERETLNCVFGACWMWDNSKGKP